MTETEKIPLNDARSLAGCLGEGRLPVADALRYAMQLADSLRKLHDAGKVHGAVTPANLELADGGVVLLPACEAENVGITPYTAPEVVLGGRADARSDVFGFGAILFEMLTGRRAFEGDSREELAANLTEAPIPASGSAAVDRLVASCLAKNPDARTCRLQKAMMELKLLSVAARRADMVSGGVLRREIAVDLSAVRAEIRQLEAELAERLEVHENRVAAMQRLAGETVSALESKVAAMGGELAAHRQHAADLDAAARSAVLSVIDQGFEGLEARMAQVESAVEEIRLSASQFEYGLASKLVDIEQAIKGQAAAIESTRTGVAQTDDLVERVVEALEALQSAVLDQGDEEEGGPGPAVN